VTRAFHLTCKHPTPHRALAICCKGGRDLFFSKNRNSLTASSYNIEKNPPRRRLGGGSGTAATYHARLNKYLENRFRVARRIRRKTLGSDIPFFLPTNPGWELGGEQNPPLDVFPRPEGAAILLKPSRLRHFGSTSVGRTKTSPISNSLNCHPTAQKLIARLQTADLRSCRR